jgi:hypothetical protein
LLSKCVYHFGNIFHFSDFTTMAPTPKALADSLLKAPPPRANGARPQNPSKAEPIVEAQLIAERLGHLDEAEPR